jgi:hypothetical protein
VFLLLVDDVASSLTEFMVLLLLLGGEIGLSKLRPNFIPKLSLKDADSRAPIQENS